MVIRMFKLIQSLVIKKNKGYTHSELVLARHCPNTNEQTKQTFEGYFFTLGEERVLDHGHRH